ncbi:MAG: YdeI/OmpD-associated family protein [Candidatus Pacearchaeota archaeon]|nr:YdeI/OmpD-associated family protein [Candidatus Pacearchaeota archaeon]
MNLGKTLYVTNRKQWRSWLAKNWDKEKEIWLIYYKKLSNKPRIPYNYAVEEALCYGWIDSIIKGVDNNRFAQRFTPRRPTSPVSEMNKERIRRLIKQKRMTVIGLNAVSKFFDKNKTEKLVVAPDILKALKANKQTWKNFKNFSEGYKKVRIGYIEDTRDYSNKMFQKRLQNFIRKTAKNKRFGMVQ